jgi:hypothetical protein
MTYTPEETKEHRRLWVEALRSGKYPQSTRHNLHDDYGFCCLGVACEISGLGKWDRDELTKRWLYDASGDAGHGADLPELVMSYYGMRDSLGMLHHIRSTDALYLLNDQGVPFPKIADIIESEPEGLLAPVAGLERVG